MLLYLHIPFCHRVCPYCSFYKHTPGATPIGTFVEALLAEAERRIPELPVAPRTVYLGGGTPSMLSATHLRRLFRGLHELLPPDTPPVEITMEANPATFDLTKARLFRQLGITRVSLGIQSFAPHVLATLGREHSPAQAVASVDLLRQAGIPSVNIDLMFAVPGQSADDWSNTLEQTLRLEPDHVSAYNLTYEEDTAFLESLRRGDVRESEERNLEFFLQARDTLAAHGYEPYETSNYARPGHRSLHNQGYWRGEEYLGLGPSAVSTIGPTRTKNIADTTRYLDMIARLGHATADAETLDAEATRLERLALGLRTSEGIPLELIHPANRHRVDDLVAEELAVLTETRLVLTRRGAALADPIAGELA